MLRGDDADARRSRWMEAICTQPESLIRSHTPTSDNVRYVQFGPGKRLEFTL
jgi:hypothetical protein